jgi:hypothetical protein
VLDLGADGEYTMSVAVEDLVGNNGSETRTFWLDTVAPNITVATPSLGEKGVQKNAVIVMTFSEPMGTVAASVPSFNLGDPSWNTARTMVTFNPTPDFSYAQNYTVTVTGTDLAGNQLAGTTSWTFTTIAWVTGVIKDPNGNAISNANVTLRDDLGRTYSDLTDNTGAFAFEAPTGMYNMSVTAPGMKELKKQVEIKAGTANNLGEQGLSSADDWTWLIILAALAAIAAIVGWFFLSRRKVEEVVKPKAEEKPKPKAEEKPKVEQPKAKAAPAPAVVKKEAPREEDIPSVGYYVSALPKTEEAPKEKK